jgi:putative DNA primase/helicase
VKRETVEYAPFNVYDKLEQWQQKVAPVGKWSSRARIAIAAVFAARNLQRLGMDSFGLNFEGPTSSGKSLLLYLASSAAGFGRPTTWDGTPTGFEQRALGHRGCVMLLDDLSHAEGREVQATQMAKLVTFRLAGNRPKARAGQYANANGLVDEDYRIIALSTSETPIWQNNTGATRGEEVRMMNVRACVSDVKDIFDGPRAKKAVGGSLEQRIAFVEQQKALCLKLQGTPFDAYLERHVSDSNAEETLRGYMTKFCEAVPLPEGERALGRIRQNFAVIYASAAQAIYYGILPWKTKATLKDVKACFDDVVAQLTATTAPLTVPDEDLVQQFKSKLDSAKFVNPKSTTATKLRSSAGIKRHDARDKVEYFVFARVVEEWFPNVGVRKRLTAALAERGLIKPGRRNDTRTKQIKLAALGGKVACCAIRRRKISEYAG